MRRAARTDRNHAGIVEAFRSLGWGVWDTSQLGGGGPDLVVWRSGVVKMVEVKDAGGTLTPAQRKFHTTAPVTVVRSLEDVEAVTRRWIRCR